MTEDSPTRSEREEAARIRRRWLNVGELVAAAGVLVGALSLWLTWSADRAQDAEKQQEKAAERRGRNHYVVRAEALGHGRLGLLRDDRHALGDVIIRYPSALGVPDQHLAGQSIDSTAFAEALLRATDGGADRQTGLLPVLLTVQYWVEDDEQRSTGLYDIVWRTEGRMLRGRTLSLIGLRLRRPGGDRAALDAAWSREHRRS